MSIDRLRSYWAFTRMPFTKDLNASMLLPTASHAEAVARITWCVTESAIGVITGEVGSGKTVAARAALSTLDASRHTLIYYANPAVGARGLYTTIITKLGDTPRFHKADLIPQTQNILAAERDERGKQVVIVLDEAHLLTGEQLEELRLLTNADMDQTSPFACLLIGQPTLKRKIKLGTFAALDQRITMRYTMRPLTTKETSDYISHHLKIAGREDTLFTSDSIKLIHQVSRGLPRAVNNLAVQALIASFAAGESIVDRKATEAAITETTD